MKIASLSVLPTSMPRANRRRKAFEGGCCSTNPNVETNKVQKGKINILA